MHFLLEAMIDVLAFLTCAYVAFFIPAAGPAAVYAFYKHKCPFAALLSGLFPAVSFVLFVAFSCIEYSARLNPVLFFLLHITTLVGIFYLNYSFYKTVFNGGRLRDAFKSAADLVFFGKFNTVSFFNIFSFGFSVWLFVNILGENHNSFLSFWGVLAAAFSVAVLVCSLAVCSFMSGYYTLLSDADDNKPGTVYLNDKGYLVQEDGSPCSRFISVVVTFLAGVLFFFSALSGKEVDGFSMIPKEKETAQSETPAE